MCVVAIESTGCVLYRMLEHVAEGQEDSQCSPVAFTVELRPQDTPESGFVGFMVPTEQVYMTTL